MTLAITDHALIRWLERQYGFDFRPYRNELAELVKPYADVQAKHARLGPDLYAVITNNTVTTVLSGKPPRRLEAYTVYEPERLNWKALQRKRRRK